MLAAVAETNPGPTWVLCLGSFMAGILLTAFVAVFFDLSARVALVVGVVLSIAGWWVMLGYSHEDNYPASVDYWMIGAYAFGFLIVSAMLITIEHGSDNH